MTMTTWCALAVVLSVANPSASQSTATKAQTDADMKELASYTLTLETLNKVDRAMRAMFVEIKKDPRFAESMKIEAELKALKKKEEPTEADDKRIEELEQRREALKDKDAMNMGNAQTLAEMAASIEKFPPMMAGLRAAGLTAREYSKFTMAMLQAGMAAGLQKAGMLKEIPAGTNPANVKFMIDHEEEFKKMQAAWEGLGK